MQLNLEQRKLIQAKPNGHNIIKGVAGSGKTTVAVDRIPFLLNHLFNISMLPSSTQNYQYLDLRYNRKYTSLMDETRNTN